jgi:hypothetical protein
MSKHVLAFAAIVTFVAGSAGCGREGASTQPPPAPGQGAGAAHDQPAAHSGKVIELGTEAIGSFSVRASRDEGVIKAGGDAPIDVWLTGSDAQVIAVRFWIGTGSADGSVKAKADIEDPAQPNHWHTHAEVPTPMPAGAELWVEIEIEGQGKKVGSFDLKH